MFRPLSCLVMLLVFVTIADAGPFRRGSGSCGASASTGNAYPAQSTASCGACAYAGVPCTAESCAAAGCDASCQLSGKSFKLVNGKLYECNGTTCKPAATTTLSAKLEPGAHLTHAANLAGLFPEGTGKIEQVLPLNSGKGTVYSVKCDKTGKILPVAFESHELWTH